MLQLHKQPCLKTGKDLEMKYFFIWFKIEPEFGQPDGKAHHHEQDPLGRLKLGVHPHEQEAIGRSKLGAHPHEQESLGILKPGARPHRQEAFRRLKPDGTFLPRIRRRIPLSGRHENLMNTSLLGLTPNGLS